MKIAFTVNDLTGEKAGYTTTHLAMAAARLGHKVAYIQVADFSLRGELDACAHGYWVPAKRYRSAGKFLDALRSSDTKRELIPLEQLDALWLRNNPNDDVRNRPWARMSAINFGRIASRKGVVVLNDPGGMVNAMTKLYLQEFPREVRPEALITRDKRLIKQFVREHEGYAVLKPLYGSGGRNVFLVQPEDKPNVNQMIEAVSRDGYVIAQEYIPEAVLGDTRLFLLNGHPMQCGGRYAAIQRVRQGSDADMRSNMTAGAKAKKAHVTPAMLQLADRLRPKLVQDGMFFVGLDIVKQTLLEINVLSPGGLVGASLMEEQPFAEGAIAAVERKVRYAQQYDRHFSNVEIATL